MRGLSLKHLSTRGLQSGIQGSRVLRGCALVFVLVCTYVCMHACMQLFTMFWAHLLSTNLKPAYVKFSGCSSLSLLFWICFSASLVFYHTMVMFAKPIYSSSHIILYIFILKCYYLTSLLFITHGNMNVCGFHCMNDCLHRNKFNLCTRHKSEMHLKAGYLPK